MWQLPRSDMETMSTVGEEGVDDNCESDNILWEVKDMPAVTTLSMGKMVEVHHQPGSRHKYILHLRGCPAVWMHKTRSWWITMWDTGLCIDRFTID